jgi:hypothetical protein
MKIPPNSMRPEMLEDYLREILETLKRIEQRQIATTAMVKQVKETPVQGSFASSSE